LKILVIDDDPFAAKLLAKQLENLGYEDVTPHHSAPVALESLESGGAAVGLVFLDLQMPEMDGVEFVRHLVRLEYRGSLVLVSGEDSRVVQAAERLARAHHLDILGSLIKPVLPSHLQAVLESDLLRPSSVAKPRRSYAPERLRHAIDHGELVNYYQPKVNMIDGSVQGMEVLVRWRHPEDGLIFPDDFIGLAEEHALIDDLSFEVLRAALDQARTWQQHGISLQMAVNISMQNLRRLQFPEMVLETIERTGLSPSSVMLEITESRLMVDPMMPLDILTRLRLRRIGLAIDDFGTGHSSLTQLRDLPFEELKIDRSFVHGAQGNPVSAAILRASLDMARELGMSSVAEGIEDRADWDYLRRAGCDVAQGYFVGRPMPAEDVPKWMEAWAQRRLELC
jgi:EAL domain-containing protein (putative c-di-GMP-specific phosphodiesterase class I)/FixJ family two-component response regulator